ncbi:Biphenyl 2,3-dioxygenase, ferredoxin component [Hyphomicrobium sp. ghe19]|nr:Biphenyl 2,3-dioxygenase, ferredoxin component [Hyphomicrobium sp. ghe19]
MSETAQPSGPDLTKGIAASDLSTGAMLLGHVGDDAVLVARQGEEIFAISAICTHYNGPLADGLLVDDTVRCITPASAFALGRHCARQHSTPCLAGASSAMATCYSCARS